MRPELAQTIESEIVAMRRRDRAERVSKADLPRRLAEAGDADTLADPELIAELFAAASPLEQLLAAESLSAPGTSDNVLVFAVRRLERLCYTPAADALAAAPVVPVGAADFDLGGNAELTVLLALTLDRVVEAVVRRRAGGGAGEPTPTTRTASDSGVRLEARSAPPDSPVAGALVSLTLFGDGRAQRSVERVSDVDGRVLFGAVGQFAKPMEGWFYLVSVVCDGKSA